MEQLPLVQNSNQKKAKKSFRRCQPFWNAELERRWFNVCQTEKNFINIKVKCAWDARQKSHLRMIYKNAQKLFDRKMRYFKRKHQKKDIEELQDLASKDMTGMWKRLKTLHTRCPSKPPLEIVREDDSISRDEQEILERWFNDISLLFSEVRENPEMAFDDLFIRKLLKKKG